VRRFKTAFDFDAFLRYKETVPPRLSFKQVMALVEAGKPVPGIKQIPDIVLSGKESTAEQAPRKKPWEQ
jgi:hypothetical protein